MVSAGGEGERGEAKGRTSFRRRSIHQKERRKSEKRPCRQHQSFPRPRWYRLCCGRRRSVAGRRVWRRIYLVRATGSHEVGTGKRIERRSGVGSGAHRDGDGRANLRRGGLPGWGPWPGGGSKASTNRGRLADQHDDSRLTGRSVKLVLLERATGHGGERP